MERIFLGGFLTHAGLFAGTRVLCVDTAGPAVCWRREGWGEGVAFCICVCLRGFLALGLLFSQRFILLRRFVNGGCHPSPDVVGASLVPRLE